MNYLPDLESAYTPSTPTIPRDKTMTSHRIARSDLAHKKSNGLGCSAVSTTFQSCIRRRCDRTERPERADPDCFGRLSCFWIVRRLKSFLQTFPLKCANRNRINQESQLQKGDSILDDKVSSLRVFAKDIEDLCRVFADSCAVEKREFVMHLKWLEIDELF